MREKAPSISPTRSTQTQQGSQASAGDTETDSRSRAPVVALDIGHEAAPGLLNLVDAELAHASSDLAAEVGVMEVKLQVLEQRVDPLDADVERRITAKCQVVDAKAQVTVDDMEGGST